jgi:hypothetical protein
MDEALWDNLDRLRKQRKWKERGVAERQAKRQRREDDEALLPFTASRSGPPTRTNAVAGPSTSTNTRAPSPFLDDNPPAPPNTSAPQPPAPPVDGDTEMTDAEASEAAKEAARAKAKGRIPKK